MTKDECKQFERRIRQQLDRLGMESDKFKVVKPKDKGFLVFTFEDIVFAERLSMPYQSVLWALDVMADNVKKLEVYLFFLLCQSWGPSVALMCIQDTYPTRKTIKGAC